MWFYLKNGDVFLNKNKRTTTALGIHLEGNVSLVNLVHKYNTRQAHNKNFFGFNVLTSICFKCSISKLIKILEYLFKLSKIKCVYVISISVS